MTDPLREMFGLPPGATGANLALQWLGRGLRAAGWEAWCNQDVLESCLRQRGVKFCMGQVGDTLTVEVVLHG